VEDAVAILVKPDDLACVVDAERRVSFGAQGMIEGSVGAAAVEDAVLGEVAVNVVPDDLACVVDALCKGAFGAQGIIERGVGGAAVQEAVDAAGVGVVPDDLAGLRRKADWIDPTRVQRPSGCFGRSALTPDSDEVCCLL
jgi:hypothetical protein